MKKVKVDCERVKRLANKALFLALPMEQFSLSAMKFGKLIREECCKDEDSHYCLFNYKDVKIETLNKMADAAKDFGKLYELSAETVFFKCAEM